MRIERCARQYRIDDIHGMAVVVTAARYRIRSCTRDVARRRQQRAQTLAEEIQDLAGIKGRQVAMRIARSLHKRCKIK